MNTPVRKRLAAALVLVLAFGFFPEGAHSQTNAASTPTNWAMVPEILKRIIPPKFADKDFDVTKFGGVGDGDTDCTDAFRAAIDACSKAGGGRVVVPSGKFLTGAIHLKNDVNLHVTKDGTILFTTNTAKYMPVVFAHYECTQVMNYSPFIYAFEQTNIAITGEGTIDGQGAKAVWHKWRPLWGAEAARLVDMGNRGVPVAERVFGEGFHLRPNFIQPVRCRNLLIEGVRVVDSPMWTITPAYCTNVIIRGVTVQTTGPNTDGCDPASCTDVWIKDCSFSNGDDCIAVKSGRDGDGRRVNIPSQNIVIQNCRFAAGHGGVTMGSETAGGIRNVFAEDCSFDSPDLDMALRFKTNPARGGFIEDICVRNCTVKTARYGIHMTMRYSSAGAMEGPAIPIIRNIDIRDVSFANLTRQPLFLQGYSSQMQIEDITIANCQFGTVQTPGATMTDATRIRLTGNRGGGMD
jgi:polygalacturonase